MALITSAASGNFSAGATWTGGVVPGVGDEARASTGHTITIDVNTTCDEVSNAGTGIYTLNDGVTLTANVTNKTTTINRNCLQFTAASPAVGTIVGNVLGATVANGANFGAVINSSTGSLTITGNVAGGIGSGAIGCTNASTGTITITGNATGGSALNAFGANNLSTGNITITGNVTGGSAATAHGSNNASTGTISITGIGTGGTVATASGVSNASTGTVNLTRAKGTPYGPGNTSGLAAAVGAANAGLGVIEIEELEFGEYGMTPTSGTGIRLKKVTGNLVTFPYVDAGAAKTLVDATQGEMPDVTDVRSGVSYASGALTGTCAVPAASSVGFGVPVDATTGTAALTPAAVWGYATRSITGGTVDTLVNAPTVPSAIQIRQEMDSNSTKLANLDATVSSRLAPSGTLAVVTTLTNAPTVPSAATIASQVRTELTTELARIDAPISGATAPTASTVATAVRTELGTELSRIDAAITTRAATGTLATDVTAIRAKTDALVTDRLAQVSTVSTTGAQLAAALS